MAFWHLRRVQAPELLDDECEAESSAPAEVQRHLEALEDAFVEQALSLGVTEGVALDVGTGTGLVPIKLALRAPGLIIHGIDLSQPMLRQAALNAGRWGVDMRIILNHGDAQQLPFDPGLFDLVLCHHVLHRISRPVQLIRELGRVAKPGGAILLKDVRRPNLLGWGVAEMRARMREGGRMVEIYEAGVRSAYTLAELRQLADGSGVAGIQAARMGPGQIGLRRKRGHKGMALN